MNIKIENYILKPCTGASERWDLIEVVQRKRESDGKIYDDYNEIAFGISLKTAKQKIVGIMLAKDTRTVDIKTFEQELTKLINKIETLI